MRRISDAVRASRASPISQTRVSRVRQASMALHESERSFLERLFWRRLHHRHGSQGGRGGQSASVASCEGNDAGGTGREGRAERPARRRDRARRRFSERYSYRPDRGCARSGCERVGARPSVEGQKVDAALEAVTNSPHDWIAGRRARIGSPLDTLQSFGKVRRAQEFWPLDPAQAVSYAFPAWRLKLNGARVPTGFIYVVDTVDRDYRQPSFMAVPTWFKDRLYFGPCKVSMRPRMKPGDYVFGVSHSKTAPRRVLFAAKIAEKISFADAYSRFPELRGPDGPVHVRPARRAGVEFPDTHYEHIQGANHGEKWRSDLRTPALDAFFVCDAADDCVGKWLGRDGPPISTEILTFLRSCSVYGLAGHLSDNNMNATAKLPIRHGSLFTGLHLETHSPELLAGLVCRRHRRAPLQNALDVGTNESSRTAYPRRATKAC